MLSGFNLSSACTHRIDCITKTTFKFMFIKKLNCSLKPIRSFALSESQIQNNDFVVVVVVAYNRFFKDVN